MEICNSYSSSSVDSTDPESSVNLSLCLTSPPTYPQRATKQDCPLIKPRLRDTLKGRRRHLQRDYNTCFFVKVYMEGVPIGRKLDLSTLSGYASLLENLSHMFDTSVICGNDRDRKNHVLTYQDTDGDWMMVGDIPWEMFLETVRRLKISKPESY